MSKTRSGQFRNPRHRMLKTRFRFAWLAAMLLALVLEGCRGDLRVPTEDPLADHSFLTQQPCAPPCWYGLEPDKSNADEIYATLKGLPFVDPERIAESRTIWHGDDNARDIGFGCLHPRDTECGGVFTVSQGKLRQLTLNPAIPLTFDLAAHQLGLPDYIDYHPFTPQGEGCVIRLDWPKRGVSITSINSKLADQCRKIQQAGRVSPEIAITQIHYFTREAFDPPPKGFLTSSSPFPGFAKPSP